jgi:carnitine 3-dehydrogenase
VKIGKNDKVACLGAGVIGGSWAICFAMNGHKTALYDINDDILKVAMERARNNLEFLKEKGLMSEEQVQETLDRITATTDISQAVSDVKFIQESGPEKYELKQKIMEAVDDCAPADAVYASSTSGLLITEIAKSSRFPGRCVGGHPYNPPHLMPLVEITKGEKTGDEAVKTAYDFYKQLGKEPIILHKETLGFIANRLQIALAREAINLVLNGVCSVEDVDKAVTFGPGLRWAVMGPNLLQHLAGGAGGFKASHQHLRYSGELWLEDMATWTKFPEEWTEVGQEGVYKEMENRAPEFGRTEEELLRFRDDMLLKLLSMHGKLKEIE